MPETQQGSDDAAQPRPPNHRNMLRVIGAAILVVAVGLPLLLIFAVRNAKDVARDYLVRGAGRAVEASSLTAAEKEDALSTIREFFMKAVADRIPKDKLESVFNEIMRGAYGNVLQLDAVKRAVEKSNLEKDQRTEALGKIRILSNAYAHGMVSDAQLAPVIAAIPKDGVGTPAALPWNDADLQRTLSMAEVIFKGKTIQAEDALPDAPDDIRRAVRVMKEAVAAARPASVK